MDNERAFFFALNSIFIATQKHCGWWVKVLRLSNLFGGISK